MNVNQYLPKHYPLPACWSLVADVMQAELGRGVTAFKTINASIRESANAMRLALHKSPDGFTPISAPADLCIVLLGKTPKVGLHHCGVFYQGSVLHALPDGNVFQELSSIRDVYMMVEFWALG